MVELVETDIPYGAAELGMLGLLVAPIGAAGLPTVVLVHDAFGLGPDTIEIARRIAALGYTVFAADVWGRRLTPTHDGDIAPLIGGMVAQREDWLQRIAAANEAAREQPEVDAAEVVLIGHCFGGSSVLEHLRAGGTARGAVSIHGGLDLIDFDWTDAQPGQSVLLCSGADDPMATAAQREQLCSAMSAADVEWELDLYSGTVHAFTSERVKDSKAPHVVAYHAKSAARAWEATLRFLHDTLPHPTR